MTKHPGGRPLKDQKKEWKDMTTGEKVGTLIGIAIILFVLSAVVAGIFGVGSGSDTPKDVKPVETSQEATGAKDESLPKLTQAALDKLGEDMKNELASTGGYRGEIVSVEPAGDDSVKVNVSTYFKDSGNSPDGGQGIANRIFTNICFEVPELKSLYVVSSSGLESKSVYRSQIPACR